MPYLNEHDRVNFEEHVNQSFYDYITSLDISKFAGLLNYLNFKLLRRWIAKNGKSYFIFAVFVGTMVCCILEAYRRVVAGYEDEKIESNGDVE